MLAGTIFIDENDGKDFNDNKTIIYGHNMRNLSMFGKLKYYRMQKGYYEDHQSRRCRRWRQRKCLL